MKNLNFVSQSQQTTAMLLDKESDNVKFVPTPYGEERHVLSTSTCCVCEERLWVGEAITGMSHLREAFKVIDARAYINGTPDYLKVSNVLLNCHWICQTELYNQLIDRTFVQR